MRCPRWISRRPIFNVLLRKKRNIVSGIKPVIPPDVPGVIKFEAQSLQAVCFEPMSL